MKSSLILTIVSFAIGFQSQSFLRSFYGSSSAAIRQPQQESPAPPRHPSSPTSAPTWFVEYETWEIAAGNEAEHHEMIRKWFHFVRRNHEKLFPEWKAARYYRQTDRDGSLTGRYIMVFEYHSLAGHHAYKERRADWSGPYADYKKVDPYELFQKETVVTEYWQPLEVDLWFEFPPPE